MGAIWFVFRVSARRRWRSILALTLMVGIVGAVALATAAGARRTASSIDRFKSESRAADIELATTPPTRHQLRALRASPHVAAVAALRAEGILFPQLPDLAAIGAPLDRQFGRTVDRQRIVAGRAARPTAPDEIAIGEALAARLHVGVGDRLDTRSYTPKQIAATLAGTADVGPLAGPRIQLRIVGIQRRLADLGDRATAGGFLVLTPAFRRAYAGRVGEFGDYLRIRTAGGTRDVQTVVAAARHILGRSLFSTQGLAVDTDGARNAIDVLTLALWIFAGVVAFAGLVTVGIVLTREVALANREQEPLRSLGASRRQRVAMCGLSSLVVAAGGGLVAVAGAVAASPLFPLGVARKADPDVGVHSDFVVLALGIVIVGAVVLTIALAAAVRATDAPSHARRGSRKPGTVAILEGVAGMGFRPPVTNGVRMAVEPGRGRSAVPVRSAILGAVFGVLGVTAVLVFASSLDHLVTSPRLYGWTWDFEVRDTTSNAPCGAGDYGLSDTRGVSAVAEVCYQNVQIDGRPIDALAFTSRRGRISPSVLAGRTAAGPHEIVLGTTTLHALGKRIGDTVQVQGRTTKLRYRIVGRAAFPTLGQAQPLSDGASFTGAGFAPIFDQNLFTRYFVGRFAPGVDRRAVAQRLGKVRQLSTLTGPIVPVEVDRLQQISWFPAALATLLGALALVAVAHALVSTVRRRRRELVLLKALGFARRQVRATVAWQATTMAIAGLVLGIPLGLLAGSVAWRLVADGLGVQAVTIVPALALVLLVPIAVVAFNLVAFLPARAAARARPGIALRS